MSNEAGCPGSGGHSSRRGKASSQAVPRAWEGAVPASPSLLPGRRPCTPGLQASGKTVCLQPPRWRHHRSSNGKQVPARSILAPGSLLGPGLRRPPGPGGGPGEVSGPHLPAKLLTCSSQRHRYNEPGLSAVCRRPSLPTDAGLCPRAEGTRGTCWKESDCGCAQLPDTT